MTKAEILSRIREEYQKNIFTQKLCGIEIRDIGCGSAKLGIIVDGDKHMNLNNSIHGGMTYTLMDNATGVAGASIGKRVVTVSCTANYLSTAHVGDNLEADCRVLSITDKKVNMEMELHNLTSGKLMAVSTSCMLVIGEYPDIPEHWEE